MPNSPEAHNSPEIAQLANRQFELGEISAEPEAQQRRGWQLEVNGEIVDSPVGAVKLVNQKMGLELQYGQHPAGYDTWKYHEPGGGGAVTIPYAVIEGRLMVGVITQDRPAAGGLMEEIPRGFMDVGETHEDAAARELHEETGLNAIKSRLEKLGDRKNPNTTFFDTSAEGEGISFYGVQVKPEELQKVIDPDGGVHYQFTTEIQEQAEGDKTAERILGSRFIPIHEAVTSPDLMTAAGAGLLTAHMLGSRVLHFTGIEIS